MPWPKLRPAVFWLLLNRFDMGRLCPMQWVMANSLKFVTQFLKMLLNSGGAMVFCDRDSVIVNDFNLSVAQQWYKSFIDWHKQKRCLQNGISNWAAP
jgi:hypothetical protein